MITGEKITLFKTFICPKCNKAYEVSNEELLAEYKKAKSIEDGMITLVCPHGQYKRLAVPEVCLDINIPYRIEHIN